MSVDDGSNAVQTGAPDEGDSLPVARERKRATSNRIVILIAAGVLIALVLGGTLYWLDARRYESTDDAFVDAQIVRIAPQVAGIVSELAVAPNRHVQAGDLLVSIETDTSAALFAQQQAALDQQAAQFSQTRTQVVQAQSVVAEAEAQLRAQAALAEQAQRDLDRLLAAQRADGAAIAATQIDAARAQLQNARAQVAAARGAVDAARAQLAGARDVVRAVDAGQTAARARVQQARISLAQNRIMAPLSGHVTNIAVNRGSYVGPGTQMMALVPDDMWITANFKETQLEDIRPGQSVAITIDAYPGVTFTGRVDSIQRGAGQAFQLLPPQNATGNFVKVVQRVPVRILFDDIDLQKYPLGPGMSVVPRIKVR